MHDTRLNIYARPVFDPDDSLVHEHLQAVQHPASTGFSSPDKMRPGGIGYAVRHYHRRMQRIEIDIQPCLYIRVKSDGSGIDDNIGIPGDHKSPIPWNEFRLRSCPLIQQTGNGLPAPGIPVNDRNMRGACQGHLNAYRPGSSPCSEQYHSFTGRVGDGTHGLHETFAIRIFPYEGIIPADNGIDGPDDRSGFPQSIEVFDDRNLMRDRAIKTCPSHRPGPTNGSPQSFRRNFTINIPPVQPMMPVSSFYHGHRRVLGGRYSKGSR